MRWKQRRPDHLAQAEKVPIRPSWQHITVQTRTLPVVTIPGKSKPITLHGQLGLVRVLALLKQRMRRVHNNMSNRNSRPEIGCKATHAQCPALV